MGTGNRLVEREVDLERLVGVAIGDLGHRLAERLEVVCLSLVGENVAVDEKEDAFLGARLPKPPDNLKSRIGFAGPRGHYK